MIFSFFVKAEYYPDRQLFDEYTWQDFSTVRHDTFHYEQNGHFFLCMNACRFMEACSGFEIRRHFEGNMWDAGYTTNDECWFKSALFIESTGDYSAVFTKKPLSIPFMDNLRVTEAFLVPNYDFNPDFKSDDHTIGDAIEASSAICATKCDETFGCIGFVTDPAKYLCWLKKELHLQSYTPDVSKIAHTYVKR